MTTETTSVVMTEPETWPTWPYLGVRCGAVDGLIVDEKPDMTGAEPIVYLRKLHDTCGFECERLVFPSWDALLSAGWAVA